MSEFTISSIRAVVAREPSATPATTPVATSSTTGVIDLTPVKEEVKPEPIDALAPAGDVAMRGDADRGSVEIVNTRASVEAVETGRARHATPSLRIARARSRSRSVHPYVRPAIMRTPTPAPRAARAAQLMRTPTPAPRAARHTPLVRTPTPAPRAVRPTPLMRTPTPAPRMPLLPGIQVEDEVTLVATNRATMRNAAATAHRTARDQRPDTAMTEVLIELVNGSVISKNFLVPTGPVTAGTLETVVRDLKAKAEKKLKKLGGTPLPRAVPRD